MQLHIERPGVPHLQVHERTYALVRSGHRGGTAHRGALLFLTTNATMQCMQEEGLLKSFISGLNSLEDLRSCQ